jgi:hypothetical protein
MYDFHYDVARCNKHEVSSNEQVQSLDEFAKDLRCDKKMMGAFVSRSTK